MKEGSDESLTNPMPRLYMGRKPLKMDGQRGRDGGV